MAWQNYDEQYVYDPVGNILSMKHLAGSTNTWKRLYQYANTSNRLVATGIDVDGANHYVDAPTLDYKYGYNTHGSMTAMPHLSEMDWDFTEHLGHITRAAGSLETNGEDCPDNSGSLVSL